MSQVIVSPKYQIVIPADIRQRLPIEPGQKLQVFILNGHIQLVPVRSIKSMRGFVKGMDTRVPREKDRL